MRRIAALPTCLTLAWAFVVAPFEHVHDHDHSSVVHAHFFSIAPVPEAGAGLRIADHDDDDDHAIARSVDSFMLVLTGGFVPFIPAVGPALVFTPSETFAPVAIVEERGHDPPCARCLIPRAPPV